jgi:Restriction endonuclease
MNSNEKGNELENAVLVLQKIILKNNPNFKNANFTCELKKILQNPKQEIDIYITIDHGFHDPDIIVFECKNWNKPIGINEIITFNHKIERVGAKNGYFIAKSFSKDALVEAEKHNRLGIHKIRNADVLIPEFISMDTYSELTSNIEIKARSLSGISSEYSSLITEYDKIIFEGNLLSMKTFIDHLKNSISLELVKKFKENAVCKVDRIYSFKTEKVFKYKNLIFQDKNIDEIKVSTEFQYKLAKPKLISSFDIDKNGQVFKYEVTLPNNSKIIMDIVPVHNLHHNLSSTIISDPTH